MGKLILSCSIFLGRRGAGHSWGHLPMLPALHPEVREPQVRPDPQEPSWRQQSEGKSLSREEGCYFCQVQPGIFKQFLGTWRHPLGASMALVTSPALRGKMGQFSHDHQGWGEEDEDPQHQHSPKCPKQGQPCQAPWTNGHQYWGPCCRSFTWGLSLTSSDNIPDIPDLLPNFQLPNPQWGCALCSRKR